MEENRTEIELPEGGMLVLYWGDNQEVTQAQINEIHERFQDLDPKKRVLITIPPGWRWEIVKPPLTEEGKRLNEILEPLRQEGVEPEVLRENLIVHGLHPALQESLTQALCQVIEEQKEETEDV